MSTKVKYQYSHPSTSPTTKYQSISLTEPVEENIPRIDTFEIKSQLRHVLGDNGEFYWTALSDFLKGKIVRQEFDTMAKLYLNGDTVALHNHLIFTILRNTHSTSPNQPNHNGWSNNPTDCVIPLKRRPRSTEDKKVKVRKIADGLHKDIKDRVRVAVLKQDVPKKPSSIILDPPLAMKYPAPIVPSQHAQDYNRISQTATCLTLRELPDKPTLRDRMLTIAYENDITTVHEDAVEYMSVAVENYLKSLLHSSIHKRLPKYPTSLFNITAPFLNQSQPNENLSSSNNHVSNDLNPFSFDAASVNSDELDKGIDRNGYENDFDDDEVMINGLTNGNGVDHSSVSSMSPVLEPAGLGRLKTKRGSNGYPNSQPISNPTSRPTRNPSNHSHSANTSPHIFSTPASNSLSASNQPQPNGHSHPSHHTFNPHSQSPFSPAPPPDAFNSPSNHSNAQNPDIPAILTARGPMTLSDLDFAIDMDPSILVTWPECVIEELKGNLWHELCEDLESDEEEADDEMRRSSGSGSRIGDDGDRAIEIDQDVV
ncbi:transcriptional regulator of RNA polII, SAGA, subunit-domain-containing protein [Paraphysoderma sedebokerense]|nr:transcriptional regulator of RNA polII, SAGA, subunit-domain-containing protein [Paraphysoderma sedebokerense]